MKKRVKIFLKAKKSPKIKVSEQLLDYWNEESFQFSLSECKKIVRQTIDSGIHPLVKCSIKDYELTHEIV